MAYGMTDTKLFLPERDSDGYAVRAFSNLDQDGNERFAEGVVVVNPDTGDPDKSEEILHIIKSLLATLIQPVYMNPDTASLRSTIISGTVTSMSQVGGIPANSSIFDDMHSAWASSVRRNIV